MTRNGDLPIQLPPIVRAGDPITATWANGIRSSLKRLTDRTPVSTNGNSSASTIKIAFMPTLKAEKASGGGFTYKINIASGYVTERAMIGDNAIVYHAPDGIIDESGDPIWHSITAGQAVYCKTTVGAGGAIDGTPTVEVDEDNLEEAHYIPNIFETTGTSGEHNYKLCVFELDGDKPKLTLFYAGDNIEHYSERGKMKNLDGTGGTVYKLGKKFDETNDTVEFRVLLQLAGVGQTLIKADEADPEDTIKFKRICNRETQPQIVVETLEGGSIIQVRGNDANGTLSHQTCEGEDQTTSVLLEWVDGLIITSGGVTFTAGCNATSGREIP